MLLDMKKCLLLLSVVLGLVIFQSQASNLPACKGSYWTNCFGTYVIGNSQGKWAGDKYVGEFRDYNFNGQGTYYFLGDHEFKGDIYVGEFWDGKSISDILRSCRENWRIDIQMD